CTDQYVRKADAGEGGVGYERMIVTSELVNNLGTNKFIPVIRQVTGQNKVPRFLGNRLYVDFSEETIFAEQFDLLLRELHKAPTLKKPPLGQNPFVASPPSDEISAKTVAPARVIRIPDEISNPSAIYEAAVELARNDDLLGWRQLVKRVRLPVNE